MGPPSPRSTPFPYTTLFRSHEHGARAHAHLHFHPEAEPGHVHDAHAWKNVPHGLGHGSTAVRSEEHTSELQSHSDLVCRLLLEKKKTERAPTHHQPHTTTWI